MAHHARGLLPVNLAIYSAGLLFQHASSKVQHKLFVVSTRHCRRVAIGGIDDAGSELYNPELELTVCSRQLFSGTRPLEKINNLGAHGAPSCLGSRAAD
jgi:hypothetical protein